MVVGLTELLCRLDHHSGGEHGTNGQSTLTAIAHLT